MYPLDFVEDFSGLSEYQIRQLEKANLVKPKREKGTKYYSYTDIYVLRVFKILRREGIPARTIKDAYSFLKNLKPDYEMSSFMLFHDGKHIYDLTDNPAIIANLCGQIVSKEILSKRLKYVAVGSELEETRQKIKKYTNKLIKLNNNVVSKSKKRYSGQGLGRLFA